MFEKNPRNRKFKKKKKNEVPSEFMERIYQVYRHMSVDPKAPEHTRMANLTFGGGEWGGGGKGGRGGGECLRLSVESCNN